MAKIVRGFKNIFRNLKEERWKKRCKEFKNFEIYESGYKFKVCMMFNEEFSEFEKDQISKCLETTWKRPETTLTSALETTRKTFNVGLLAQGANGGKILVLAKKCN